MTFQRAPPEVNGFALMTWVPGLIRSAHVLMPLGFPSRTTNTTIESVTMPPNLSLFQLVLTRPACESTETSGASERFTTSAGRPLCTAAACGPEAPYDCLNVTSLPAAVAWKAGMILLNAAAGVE